MAKLLLLIVAAIAFAATALAADGGVPWADGTLESLLSEAKDRNMPLMLYVGNET